MAAFLYYVVGTLIDFGDFLCNTFPSSVHDYYWESFLPFSSLVKRKHGRNYEAWGARSFGELVHSSQWEDTQNWRWQGGTPWDYQDRLSSPQSPLLWERWPENIWRRWGPWPWASCKPFPLFYPAVSVLIYNFQMTIHRLMSLIAMAFLWTGSQIPVYLFGLCRFSRYFL